SPDWQATMEAEFGRVNAQESGFQEYERRAEQAYVEARAAYQLMLRNALTMPDAVRGDAERMVEAQRKAADEAKARWVSARQQRETASRQFAELEAMVDESRQILTAWERQDLEAKRRVVEWWV